MRGRRASLSLGILLTACADGAAVTAPRTPPTAAAAAAASPNGYPPYDVDFTISIAGACDFDVDATLVGKEKILLHPNGRLVISAPGLVARLTNVETGASVTESITGTIRAAFDDDGNAALELTGRSLYQAADGLFIIVGRWTEVVAPDGSAVVPLAGTGQRLDVCSMLD